MSAVEADEVLGPVDVARILDVHVQTVRSLIKSRELRAVKRGNRYYIRRSWLEEFLDDGAQVPA